MRVAVLADIHGNLPALEAVLRDVDAAGVDAVVLGGDLADGPMPAQTLDRLEELGERAVWVRGNSDRWLADAFDGTFQPSGLPTNPPAARASASTASSAGRLPWMSASTATRMRASVFRYGRVCPHQAADPGPVRPQLHAWRGVSRPPAAVR